MPGRSAGKIQPRTSLPPSLSSRASVHNAYLSFLSDITARTLVTSIPTRRCLHRSITMVSKESILILSTSQQRTRTHLGLIHLHPSIVMAVNITTEASGSKNTSTSLSITPLDSISSEHPYLPIRARHSNHKTHKSSSSSGSSGGSHSNEDPNEHIGVFHAVSP